MPFPSLAERTWMGKRTWVRRVALLALTSLVAAACGARVPPYAASVGGGALQAGQPSASGSQGTAPVSGSNGVSSGGGASLSGPQPAGTPSSASSKTGGSASQSPTASKSSSGGTSLSSLTVGNFPYDPQQQAALCTGTAGNTSSGPGVTSSSITFGNVSGISGLIPNSFKPGYQAVESAFDSVNRFGGICGRQLKLDVEDDQQSASNNQADVEDLIPKVLGFVGSLSDADNGGVPAMVSAGTPDMGPAINTNRSNSSVYWSATGGSVIIRNGRAYIINTWPQGLRQYNDLPKSVAILSYSIAISAQAGEEFANAFKQEGVSICYTDYNIQAGAQATQIPSDVEQMKAKGCQGVYTTMDVVGNANMLDAMQNQNFHPPLIAVTYEGYTPDQISAAGQSAAQGLQVALTSVPLTDSNPGVELYQQELNTYEPGNPTSEFGLASWADAEMLIYALLKAGRNPTRSSLVNALSQITGWSTDGAYGPYTPSSRTGETCATNVIVRGNTFVRDWPPSGLFCGGQMIDVGPA